MARLLMRLLGRIIVCVGAPLFFAGCISNSGHLSIDHEKGGGGSGEVPAPLELTSLTKISNSNIGASEHMIGIVSLESFALRGFSEGNTAQATDPFMDLQIHVLPELDARDLGRLSLQKTKVGRKR